MAKDETPTLYMIRRGDTLQPEMGMDAELLRRIPPGTRIKVKVSEGRSQDRLRLYWAYLGRVIKATHCAPSSEALHGAVKMNVGLTEPVLFKGYSINVPKSVAFDKMSESEFAEFLQSAEEFIIKSYGISIADAFGENAA